MNDLVRHRYADGKITKATDKLAVEEPLEIILDYPKQATCARLTLAVTMRTPGLNEKQNDKNRSDEELAAGFLFAEGIIKHKSDILSLARDSEAPRPENTIVVSLTHVPARDPDQLHRHFFTNSACGVCGKTSMQALELLHQPTLTPDTPRIASPMLCALPARLREQQQQFASTGGVHACALFSPQGELLLLREDIGRHNAFDKLIGACVLQQQLDLFKHSVILVSGRASFELVQKALMADVPVLAAIGAPSSLAVQLAQRHNLTLIGFLKAEGFNIYHAPERVI